MALGKAFIEVHADTKPFARELERELERILSGAESDVNRSGKKLGNSLGDGVAEGIGKNDKKISTALKKAVEGDGKKSIFTTLGKSIVDTLADGLSGLPAEVKAALGVALVAATPLLGAGLSGLIAGALATGFAGIGFLVALQFDSVRQDGMELVSFLRTLFVSLGAVFVEPVKLAFREVEKRFSALGPAIAEIFRIASKFIEPLTDGFIGFFENLAPGLSEALENSAGLVDALAFHFKVLGKTIGDALMIITGSDSAEQGLADILTVLETLIITAAIFIRVLTDIYGILRQIAPFVSSFAAFAGAFGDNGVQADKAAKAVGGFRDTLGETIAPTQAEEKALKEINDAIVEFTQATGNAWQSNINFEQSLDDMSAKLKLHRGQLDLNTQAGRDNQQAILNASQALIKQREDTIALTGNVKGANETFATNKKRLEDAAFAAGISRTKFNELTSAILTVPPPISPGIQPSATKTVEDATGKWQGLGNAIGAAINAAKRALGISFSAPGGGGLGKAVAHGDGGVFSSPHMGIVAEAGPEAIIPLSNPARAQQVMNQAGLGGTGNVNVYIGNKEIDAYVDNRVDRRMSMTARTMAYGSRSV